MKKVKAGIVGFGFIGPHHLDAMRRTGLVEVVAIATQNLEKAKALAAHYSIPKAYGSWQDVVADPDIDVVDITTPTHLHAEIAIAAANAGKHVIVDKPMAMNSSQAESMLTAARNAGVIHAVTFSIRYNIMVQQARAMVSKGDLGAIHFVHGHYYQEWLLRDTDYNWRIEPEIGGSLAMVADAGAHWYDMVQHVTGLKIVKVLADLSRFIETRKKPTAGGGTEDFKVTTPDLGMVLFEFDNGARGMFATGAMHAGHKNDLSFELNGADASLRWQQENPNALWIGRREAPTQIMVKDPDLLDPSVAPYAKLPGGHNEAWADAFRNLMANILEAIFSGMNPDDVSPMTFPTFSTGLEVARVVDAISESATQGGRWTSIKDN